MYLFIARCLRLSWKGLRYLFYLLIDLFSVSDTFFINWRKFGTFDIANFVVVVWYETPHVSFDAIQFVSI